MQPSEESEFFVRIGGLIRTIKAKASFEVYVTNFSGTPIPYCVLE